MKIKTYTKKMKNWLKIYLCMFAPFFSAKPTFYRQKPRGERREKIGEQTLPQQTLTGRENAVLAAFLRPWCGQMATLGWGSFLV